MHHKAMASILSLVMALAAFDCLHVNAAPGSALDKEYYDKLCPSKGTKKLQDITDDIVRRAVLADPGLSAALIRLAFHDSFVNGCDGSVLVDSTSGNVAEKDAQVNASIRGFQVIDEIKTALEALCAGVYSCADILQEAAQAAMKHINQNSPHSEWNLQYGRRDGRVSLATQAQSNLPSASFNYSQLVTNFANKGLNKFDLMVLSGAHTFGISRCGAFSRRLYNFTGNGDQDPALDPTFATQLKAKCPPGVLTSTVDMDPITPDTFDHQYFQNVQNNKGLFVSDAALKDDPINLAKVASLGNFIFVETFFEVSMKKLSEVQPLLYPQGEIRSQCNRINGP